jgi:hypothetical protein
MRDLDRHGSINPAPTYNEAHSNPKRAPVVDDGGETMNIIAGPATSTQPADSHEGGFPPSRTARWSQ